ncbi:hypothetical protein FS842_010186 [Serendipita sp. 407]|nr:hypothetical protein FS842_010186 [Serendipita sp. 407]
MPVKTFDVGIAFQTLDILGGSLSRSMSGRLRSRGNIDNAAATHWILVFSSRQGCCTVELKNDGSFITSSVQHMDVEPLAWYFGSFRGLFRDIRAVADDHDMNDKRYHELKNNCHHWTALFLYNLMDFADDVHKWRFRIHNRETARIILRNVKIRGNRVTNKKNNLVDTALTFLDSLL